MVGEHPRIRIVLSDAALEPLGRVLATRLPNVELGNVPDAQADINYYMPLSGRHMPASTCEIGWVQAACAKAAGDVDLVICPDADVQASAVKAGARNAVVIPPDAAMEDDAHEHSCEDFADAHARVFEGLCASEAVSELVQQSGLDTGGFTGSVRLLLHGDEHKSLGGPSFRVPRTAQALRAQGVAAQAGSYTRAADISEEVVHLFNVWNPYSALSALEALNAAGKRVVLSPIYLDLRAYGFWNGQLPELPLEDLEAYAAIYHKACKDLEGRGRLAEPVAGYNAMVRAMLDMADHVIFLSQAERNALADLGAVVEDARASLVANPVDAELWRTGDSALFRKTYLDDLSGPQEYVLCVGRIEPRKNQLLLARALRDLPLRLVLVGHEGDAAYTERVRSVAGPDFLVVNRLEAGGAMLRAAVAGARVFCLPSWAEGASLAALEAAAAGVPLVLGERSSERSYFGDLAEYCDVGDPRSIADAVERSLSMSADDMAARAQKLRAKVAQEYSWQAHAAATAQAYRRAAQTPQRGDGIAQGGVQAETVRAFLVVDLTRLARGAPAQVSGMQVVQAEAALAAALRSMAADVRFICWSDAISGFVDLPDAMVAPVMAARYLAQLAAPPPACLTPECTLVVAGDAWRDDETYLSGLADLKARSGCALVPLVHDLDPLAFSFRHDVAEAAAFQRRFNRLARMADGFLPVSQATAVRTQEVVARLMPQVPPITPLRLGDPVMEPEEGCAPEALLRTFGAGRFVLALGPVEARANIDILLRVWARFADEGAHENLHLVIAGNVIPDMAHIPERIARDPRLAPRVHLLDGLDAGGLDWLTRACLFTVFAAHDTDRALPVAHSLAYAKPCIATCAGAATDIGSDLVEHIDPEDFTAWHACIGRYASSPSRRLTRSRAIAQTYCATTWEHTAQALVDIVKCPRAIRGPVPVFSGVPIDAGMQGGIMQAFFEAGWHPREARGRWAAAAQCNVTLNLSRQASGDAVTVLVVMQLAPPHPEVTSTLIVCAGEQMLFTAPVSGGAKAQEASHCDIIVPVPVTALDGQGCVTLTFHSALYWEQAQNGTTRQVGVGLLRMTVLEPGLCNPLHALRDPSAWSTGETGMMIDTVDHAHRVALQAGGVGGRHALSPAWGLGSVTGRCDVAVPVLPTVRAQTLWVTCRPVAVQDHPVRVEFYWNARLVAQATFNANNTVRTEITLSADDMAMQAPHVLSVRADSVLMPVDLGLGLTENIAGVGVFEIELAPEVQTG